MGKKSKKILCCKVFLSITNQCYNAVVTNIKESNFGEIIAKRSYNNAKVIDEKWEVDPGLLGALNQTINQRWWLPIIAGPLTFISGVSWTNATIIYKIEVDLYNLTKNYSNICIAQVSKLFKNKRKRKIIDIMKTQIKDGFEDGIKRSTGILSPMVVTVKSVDIY